MEIRYCCIWHHLIFFYESHAFKVEKWAECISCICLHFTNFKGFINNTRFATVLRANFHPALMHESSLWFAHDKQNLIYRLNFKLYKDAHSPQWHALIGFHLPKTCKEILIML